MLRHLGDIDGCWRMNAKNVLVAALLVTAASLMAHSFRSVAAPAVATVQTSVDAGVELERLQAEEAERANIVARLPAASSEAADETIKALLAEAMRRGATLDELTAMAGAGNMSVLPAPIRRGSRDYTVPFVMDNGATLSVGPPMSGTGRLPVTEQGSGYRGSSGARYRYDLSRPADAIRYSVNPKAQLEYSISVDPRREIDASLGQQGAGILR